MNHNFAKLQTIHKKEYHYTKNVEYDILLVMKMTDNFSMYSLLHKFKCIMLVENTFIFKSNLPDFTIVDMLKPDNSG